MDKKKIKIKIGIYIFWKERLLILEVKEIY